MAFTDTLARWAIDRYTNAQYYLRARTPRTAPTFIRNEAREPVLFSADSDIQNFIDGMSPIEQQRAALAISWIYADLHLMSNFVSHVPVHVKEKRSAGLNPIIVESHEFSELLKKPNEHMTLSFLIRMATFHINLSEWGAFWFLSFNRDNPNELLSIWPMLPHKVRPIRSPDHYIKQFAYRFRDQAGAAKILKIPATHVVWFRYPDPHNYYKSLPPLRATLLTADVESGIQDSQRQFYTDSRGIPLTLVSLDESLSEQDYEQARADIKNDWESGSTLAVARAGLIDVKSIGLTQKDLEILGSQTITRDKIDSIFFGEPIRAEGVLQTAGALSEVAQWITRAATHPLLSLYGEQLSISVQRFYEKNQFVVFDDVRAQDRALTLQERTVARGWTTVNEQREQDGMPPLNIPQMPELGGLLVPLAGNPSFVASMFGFKADPSKIADEPDIGNLEEQEDRRATVARESDVNIDEAVKAGLRVELDRWRTVATRAAQREGSATARTFTSDIIPEDMHTNIWNSLNGVSDSNAVKTIFKEAIRAI